MPFPLIYPTLRLLLVRRLPERARKLLVYLGTKKVTVGVSAVISDSTGRVLIVHHTYRNPAWGLPSGLVGLKEQPSEALERELREELGAEASVGSLLHADIARRARHLTLFYRAAITGEPRIDGHEIDAVKFVRLDELEMLLGLPTPPWI